MLSYTTSKKNQEETEKQTSTSWKKKKFLKLLVCLLFMTLFEVNILLSPLWLVAIHLFCGWFGAGWVLEFTSEGHSSE